MPSLHMTEINSTRRSRSADSKIHCQRPKTTNPNPAFSTPQTLHWFNQTSHLGAECGICISRTRAIYLHRPPLETEDQVAPVMKGWLAPELRESALGGRREIIWELYLNWVCNVKEIFLIGWRWGWSCRIREQWYSHPTGTKLDPFGIIACT